MLNWINPDIFHSYQAHNFPDFWIPHLFPLCFKYCGYLPGKRGHQPLGCQRGSSRKRFLVWVDDPITFVTRVVSPDPGRPTERGSLEVPPLCSWHTCRPPREAWGRGPLLWIWSWNTLLYRKLGVGPALQNRLLEPTGLNLPPFLENPHSIQER